MDPSSSLPEPQPSSETPAISSQSQRPRRGKVARLRKAIRDQINEMMLDGVPYAEILQKLADTIAGITEHNLTTWAAGGYKDWLREQHRLEETRVKQEVAMDLACPDGGSKIHEATLQLAATNLSEMVRNFDFADFQELLQDDPAKVIPLLNSLARISDAEIRCESHRLGLQERTARIEQPASARKPAGLSPETRQKMEAELNLM